MGQPPRKPSTTAEVALVSLKSCLVNLPASLVSVLSNANTAAQDVVIELQCRTQTLSSGTSAREDGAGSQKSVYVGWTGMPSRRRPALGMNRNSYANGVREQEISPIEIDDTFAGLLGLTEGQRVGIFLHLDPPVAHTVHIEPLTPADWEVIELHASFLELNLLSQVRALPNPSHSATASVQASHSHPLALHLSPTSTANVIVTSLIPPIPSSSPFAKIASDAEVIVAPKGRPRTSRAARQDDRSVASTSRRSARSGGSSLRAKATTERDIFFLRGIDRGICHEWFSSDHVENENRGLCIWVHGKILAEDNAFMGRKWVVVSIVRPAGLRAQLDQHQMQQLKEQESNEAGLPASKVVAQVRTWADAPDEQHAALSSTLCSILGFGRMVGCITKVEPAPPPLQKAGTSPVRLFPFLPDSSSKKEGLRFGGESKLSRQAVANRVQEIHGSGNGLLQGPISNGMLLPASEEPSTNLHFSGGIVRFQPSSGRDGDKSFAWFLGSEQNFMFDVQPEIPRTMKPNVMFPTFDPGLPTEPPESVGIDKMIQQCISNLRFSSSILLTGGTGSGKTSLAHLLCQRLSEEHLFNTTYFFCRQLLTDETRVSQIKDTLTRLFMSACWCARLGGQSIVVLDDLDKICPVETELQVGNDNGRSRLITGILCSIVRYYCTPDSGIALLATAQSKDTLNRLIISGHIVGDIISLKAPDKEARRKILVKLTSPKSTGLEKTLNGHVRNSSNNSNHIEENSWMDPRPNKPTASAPSTDTINLSPSLDLLDLAGRTDGFMPGDLSLLVSRARTECLTRLITSPTFSDATTANPQNNNQLTLTKSDFTTALQNFTPSSLRNVPLTHSTTTFSSIGGLHSTRTTLLETLFYPTKYAPIFANSPLRLRSGLLLYGYPGCGKTLLASAVAGECGLNFISVKGPEILNKYIGASEKSVRDLFERAQAAKPCVLFFDEFDSVAPKRGHDSTGVTDRVVNQLLTQMDGAEGLEGVYVLAATSRPDLIDPALLRPGRLDKSLLCDMPDREDRLDILSAVSKKLVLKDEVGDRLGEIADRTTGYSGADLQALMYNAHLEAVHQLIGDTAPPSAVGKSNTENGITKKSSRGTNSSRNKKAGKKFEFYQFLYDPTLDAEARASPHSTSSALEPHEVVEEKLAAMRLAKKTERRRLRLASSSWYHMDDDDVDSHVNGIGRKKNGEADVKQEVVITWANIERALATTRCSISEQERMRLGAIYHEFVVGRNGEMPSGDGGREVGGRSSLM
ncbi:hypothetical protein EPUS_06411 [Endocarpon pusillum Z07020]|uniref:Peroxisomal ATPase PEX1 n=1 Tax=Endocarpon pusillum (strain Z07020 / HMAS-L-300199) TaxID=1263415 RepID=U1G8K9_ENDPU|nr:uncharacterized protein EPUS_06411 [Endocarpon pusillum Z07020]ERF68021.1 hypothetical protein EPUS_06411 [Endocarpon pusillum Z07020]